jgi:hypothetical protein
MVRKDVIYGVVAPDGFVGWFGHDDLRAWQSFFQTNAHRLPLAEAIRAYAAIGYKCKLFKLVEIEE